MSVVFDSCQPSSGAPRVESRCTLWFSGVLDSIHDVESWGPRCRMSGASLGALRHQLDIATMLCLVTDMNGMRGQILYVARN